MGDAAGKQPVRCNDTPGLHRQPHPDPAAQRLRPRARRGGRRAGGHRQGDDERRRLADGAVRARRPDRDRRPRARVRGAARQAGRAADGAAASGSSRCRPRASSAARRARASTATRRRARCGSSPDMQGAPGGARARRARSPRARSRTQRCSSATAASSRRRRARAVGAPTRRRALCGGDRSLGRRQTGALGAAISAAPSDGDLRGVTPAPSRRVPIGRRGLRDAEPRPDVLERAASTCWVGRASGEVERARGEDLRARGRLVVRHLRGAARRRADPGCARAAGCRGGDAGVRASISIP